jgi:glutamate---cysteine ligase / carboxylate-amine ligase
MGVRAGLRFGVEEEFFVVEPGSRAVVPRAREVVELAGVELGRRVCGEITELQVEARTEPCRTLAELHEQLVGARVALGASAGARGLRVVATGTPVVGRAVPSPITVGHRQDLGNAMYLGLHHELSISAVHVHVELPDRERAVLVSNHLRPYLPVLAALTANSPYWDERDTGYASWRVLQWRRWPAAGPPPYFTSAAHYDELVGTLRAAGALVDDGTIFWDVRPSARLPTLEIRVADMPVRARESALIAALVRALVVVSLDLVERGDPGPVVAHELMGLAYWRAARDGLSGQGVDVHTGRCVPAAELARRLLTVVSPVLAEYGDLDQVTAWLDELLRDGDGASRQRRAARPRDSLTDVVDHLIAETAGAAVPA